VERSVLNKVHQTINKLSKRLTQQNQQEPCQHGHPPPNVFAHWKNVYVVEQIIQF
jgi:hypothetical protein